MFQNDFMNVLENDHRNDHENVQQNDFMNVLENDHRNDHENVQQNDFMNVLENDHENDFMNVLENDHRNDHENVQQNDFMNVLENDHGNDHENDFMNDRENDHGNDQQERSRERSAERFHEERSLQCACVEVLHAAHIIMDNLSAQQQFPKTPESTQVPHHRRPQYPYPVQSNHTRYRYPIGLYMGHWLQLT